MRDSDRDTLDAFEDTVSALSHVQQAQRLFGTPDYLLRVLTRDLAAFQRLYDDELARLPGVQKLSSTLVMKRITENQPLPL
ncbi:Lrp/AsnC ligand binding domain-containing protein [Pseudonocardia halophobica]|uniref:Lrp/AsnC ligand binding domain-containing protein n=1 Tax=Pseudonocardia halophobica TaxID=29401 RepID=UPI003D89F5FB